MRGTFFRYIFREILIYFLVSFLFFFLIFFVNQILLMAEDILSKRAPFTQVALLVFYALPSIIATSAPFAALVGTLMGLGRFVSDREIIAANALGIPLRAVFGPVLLAGVLISVVSFLTNDILLPAGTIRYMRLYRSILTSTPALELEANSIKKNQKAIVVTGGIQGREMESLLVIDSGGNGERRFIAAPGATIRESDNPSILMSLEMRDPRIISLDRKNRANYDVIGADLISYHMLMKQVAPNYSASVTPREISSRDLYAELKKKEASKDAKQINLYRMEFHKKFSIPFGAFFFSVLAFPLGLMSKTNGQSVGFVLGLIIAVLYWALLIGGQTLSMRVGLDGALMMWLPNIIILGAGVFFLGRRLWQ